MLIPAFLPPASLLDRQGTACLAAHIGPVHVDQKIVHQVLRATTGDTVRQRDLLTQNWCKLKVQSPHYEGGYAITPKAASGLAAFYSATRKFVAFLASLPMVTHGYATARSSQFTTRGLTPSYKHSSRPMPASFRNTSAQNGNRTTPPRLLPPPLRCPRSTHLSSLPLLTN